MSCKSWGYAGGICTSILAVIRATSCKKICNASAFVAYFGPIGRSMLTTCSLTYVSRFCQHNLKIYTKVISRSGKIPPASFPHLHYMQQIRCPLLVIQGKNDPWIIERESRDVGEQLQAAGKQVEYLLFEDEGHDGFTYANRVTCYTTIAEFFKRSLGRGRRATRVVK